MFKIFQDVRVAQTALEEKILNAHSLCSLIARENSSVRLWMTIANFTNVRTITQNGDASHFVQGRKLMIFLPAVISQGSQMTQISAVVEQLKKERERAQTQVQRIDKALAALESPSSNRTTLRTMSVGARRKISLAQKAGWVKVTTGTPKRTMSVTARRKIAATQRVRWAKVKSAA